MLLCLAVLRYRQRMLDCEGEPLPSLGTTCDAFCSFHQPVVGCCCCILLLKIYGWAVVILVRLGCWVLACDSERIGCWGKSPTNGTRNLTDLESTRLNSSHTSI